jgi:UDP-GlcNAc:undecaprenyl-phosphate GlcNAc-1-phosphate transferase
VDDFLLATIAMPLAWCAARFGSAFYLVDRPDARKRHSGDIPLTGGIAIVLTILLGTWLGGSAPISAGTLLIALAVFAVGVYDDWTHLRAATRLLIHYGSGIALAILGGVAIHNVGNLLAFGDIELLLLTVPLTALSVAGLCNAYNMIDGIDGLATCMALIPLTALYVLGTLGGHATSGSLAIILVPLVLFLLFNLGPDSRLLPKMFLGDGGSVTLGFLVTAALIYFSQGDEALIRPVTALWLVGLPLMDMLATMLRRAMSGRSLMASDRLHLHHTLLDRGLSSRQTLLLLTGYGCACAALGLALESTPESLSLLAYCLLFMAHCRFVTRQDRAIVQSPAPGCADLHGAQTRSGMAD